MLDWLIDLDKSLLLFCNAHHTMWADNYFWMLSARWYNLFLILPLLYIVLSSRKWAEASMVLLAIAVTILLCDQIASSVCKPLFERLRPTHDPSLSVIIVNNYRGGLYGFVSSHAANSFGVATLLCLIFRDRLFTISIFLWAIVVSYSRIYLGVHFPGDILAGATLGCIVGWGIFRLYNSVRKLTLSSRCNVSLQSPYFRDVKAKYFAIYIFLLLLFTLVVASC